MRKVIILRGPSGCGKTTFTRKVTKKHGVPSVACSADHFFEDREGNYNFDGSALPMAWEQCYENFKSALGKKYPLVFVDNTNIKKEWMKPYAEYAVYMGYDVEIVNCYDGKTSAQELAARNKHGVPLATIERMISGFEPCESVQELLG